MTLDDEGMTWQEFARVMAAEEAAARQAEWEFERMMESVEAEEARWHRIMAQAAMERPEVHYQGDHE